MKISIPDDLHQRMQPLGNSFNWSNLAAESFKTAVENAEYLSAIKSAAKRRLKESEIEEIGGLEKFAYKQGQEWAANTARAIELVRLAEHVKREDGIDFPDQPTCLTVILEDEFDERMEEWTGGGNFGKYVVEAYEAQFTNSSAQGALDMYEEIETAE